MRNISRYFWYQRWNMTRRLDIDNIFIYQYLHYLLLHFITQVSFVLLDMSRQEKSPDIGLYLNIKGEIFWHRQHSIDDKILMFWHHLNISCNIRSPGCTAKVRGKTSAASCILTFTRGRARGAARVALSFRKEVM